MVTNSELCDGDWTNSVLCKFSFLGCFTFLVAFHLNWIGGIPRIGSTIALVLKHLLHDHLHVPTGSQSGDS